MAEHDQNIALWHKLSAGEAEARTAGSRREAVGKLPFAGGRAIGLGGSRPVDGPFGRAIGAEVAVKIMASAVSNGSVAVPLTLSGPPVQDGQRVTFLRSIVPTQAASGGRFSYLKQTTRTNAAAVVAAGAKKPTSVFTLERVDDELLVVAHMSEPIPRMWLRDSNLLAQFIDSEMAYGVSTAVDSTILDTITGGSPLTPAAGADPITTCRHAITLLEDQDLAPDAFVFSPGVWEDVEASALELFASSAFPQAPLDATPRRLFGIPVVVSTGATTPLLGAFGGSAILFEAAGEGLQIDWSEQTFDPTFGEAGASDFERNMIRARAEIRIGPAITRPTGFVVLDIAEPGS